MPAQTSKPSREVITKPIPKIVDFREEEVISLATEIEKLCSDLGVGRVNGVAYDTAWIARLSSRYPQDGFEGAVEWLRKHQHRDGTWGSGLVHFHDRFISTLAAITALREVGRGKQDARRVKRGEDALWRITGRLSRDDSDTIGFPILSVSLTEEAAALGLDIPLPPVRFSQPYKKKVRMLLDESSPTWRKSTVTFSFEALRLNGAKSDGNLLETNHSIAVSPAATAAYLLSNHSEPALQYLRKLIAQDAHGAAPAVAPIDIFEVSWSLNHLNKAGAISKEDAQIKRVLEFLWKQWSPEKGVGYSSHFAVTNLDDTASCFTALRWGGYPVSADVFAHYEMDDHFCCFHDETNPSVSAHVRLLSALRLCEDHPRYQLWVEKIVNMLRRNDENGSYWWDKWHSSPYYVNSTAVRALYGVADDLARSRFKWIMKTQNPDGGWGYFGRSTPEESAYCLEALLFWNRIVEPVESSRLKAAAQYLRAHLKNTTDYPLWIGKSLYTPSAPVKAVILGSLYSYVRQ